MTLFSLKKAALAVLSFGALYTQATPVPASDVAAGKAQSSSYKNVVYFTSWSIYGRNYLPAQLPTSQLTHVHYAFAKPLATGEVILSDTWADTDKKFPGDSLNETGTNVYGNMKQLFLLKKSNRHIKTLLSIGGWTFSSNFSAASSTPETRARFASSSVSLLANLGFDGLDVDWEYPANAAEGHNFLLLLQAVRAELDAYAAKYAPGYHFLLAIASPAGPVNYNKLPLGAIAHTIDYFNFMGYDYAGGFSNVTGHQANLFPNPENSASTPFSTDVAVEDYLEAGVPPCKVLLGMPVYGRAFENANGLGKPFQGVGNGSWEAGVWDYKALPRAGASVLYDEVAGATYSYDAATKELVTYDTADMVAGKLAYVRWKGLGGSMFWEASADRTDDQSLIGTSFGALSEFGKLDQSKNLLSYPKSTYDNVRKGFQAK